MSNRAWVTLATNDSYGLGALVLAHSLRRAGSSYPAVVLITPSVTDAMRDRLSAVFAEVVTVDVLDSGDAAHLALLQRPELGITFTKLHCWNLTQYEKCVFLDADALVVQNCDELFEREEISAAPDVGWPDCFNSGVFVYTPSAETFDKLIKFAQERGSFDGGDQGLLNAFFSDWAHGDINKHLPFLYNVTSAAFYSYLPALKHYGQNLKIIHFIGAAKPWLQHFNWETRSVDAPEHLRQFLQLWWDLFVADVHAQLDVAMSGVAGNLARVTLGSTQREAIDDLTRRQGWEAGNIDYMGADSFDNIWAKISQTLSKARPSPPRQSPPRGTAPAQSATEQVVVQHGETAQATSEPVEVAKEVVPTEEPAIVKEPEALPAQVTADILPEKTQVEIATPVKESIPVTESTETAAPVDSVLTETLSSLTLTEAPKDKESEIVVEPKASEVVEEVKSSVASEEAKAPIATEEAKVPVTQEVKAPVASEEVKETVAAVEVKAPVATEEATVPVATEAAAPIATEEVKPPVATEEVKPPVVTEEPVVIDKVLVVEQPPTPDVAAPTDIPVTVDEAEVAVIPSTTEVPVETPSVESASEVKPSEEQVKKAAVIETPKVEESVAAIQSSPIAADEAAVCPIESTPEKSVLSTDSVTDSPPLANTPSKEEIPDVTAAKSTEDAAQETRL